MADCWMWAGIFDRDGYGRYSGQPAHRVVYEGLVAPIPVGMELDHLCRTRACVNPAHLEVVVHRVNVMRSPTALAAINARKTHCVNGHPFTEANTAKLKDGRRCLACQRAAVARYKRRLAEKS